MSPAARPARRNSCRKLLRSARIPDERPARARWTLPGWLSGPDSGRGGSYRSFGRTGGQAAVRLIAWPYRDAAGGALHVPGLGTSRLRTSTARAAITAIGITPTGCGRCLIRVLTRSVIEIASCCVSLVKIANIDPRRGSSAANVCSIRCRARCWRARKLIMRSCSSARATVPRARLAADVETQTGDRRLTLPRPPASDGFGAEGALPSAAGGPAGTPAGAPPGHGGDGGEDGRPR